MESDLQHHGINPLNLLFRDRSKEVRYLKEILPFRVAVFRTLCLLAAGIHLVYAVLNVVNGNITTLWVRIAICLPSFIIIYLMLSPVYWGRNYKVFRTLGYYAIIMTVVTQLVFNMASPNLDTQISHAIPIVIYGTYFFVGVRYRDILYILNPLVVVIPVAFLWLFFEDYTVVKKVNNSIIILINVIMAMMAKYHLERVRRLNFSEKEFQREQQEKIIMTNHQLAQQKDLFRGLAERSEDMITIRNLDEKLEYVSPASEKVIGYRPGEMIGRKISEFIYEEDKNHFFKSIKPEIHEGDLTTWEARLIHKKGHPVWVQTFGLPIKDFNGKVVRVQGSLRDISKSKEAELALKEANKNLKMSNEAKTRFFAIISHDLRGPFNNIVALTTLVKEHGDSYTKDELVKLIEHLASSATSARNLLENLLVWSKNQLQGAKIIKSNLSLLMIVNSVNSMMAKWALDKNLTIITDIDESFTIYADKDMVSTIFRNLISNAIKFSNEGGEIKISAKEGKYGMAEICIEDQGVGIAEDRMQNLFDLDKKVTTKGTSNEVGSGLGLKICKDFVEVNGGKMKVESKLGEGTCFKLTIPIKESKKVISHER